MVFQGLPKSRYVEVVSGQDITQHVHHHDENDDILVQLPYASTDNGQEPMEVDQIDTRSISPPSEFDIMCIFPNIALCPDPAFEIDDVSMEPVYLDVDADTAQAMVPRGGLNHNTDCS